MTTFDITQLDNLSGHSLTSIQAHINFLIEKKKKEFINIFAHKDIDLLNKYLATNDNYISMEKIDLLENTFYLEDVDESFDFIIELTKVKNWNEFNKTIHFDAFFIELLHKDNYQDKLIKFCQYDKNIIEFLLNTDIEEHVFFLKSGLGSNVIKILDDFDVLHYNDLNFRKKLYHGNTENLFVYGLENYPQYFNGEYLQKIYFSQLTNYSKETLNKITTSSQTIDCFPSLKKMDINYILKQALKHNEEPVSFDEYSYQRIAYDIVLTDNLSHLVKTHKFSADACYAFTQAFNKSLKNSSINHQEQKSKFLEFVADMQANHINIWNKFLKRLDEESHPEKKLDKSVKFDPFIKTILEKAQLNKNLEKNLNSRSSNSIKKCKL